MTTIADELLSEETASLQAANPRLLLVDDDQVILQTLTTVLAGYGFTVVPACDVHQALGLITQQPFDVLLSDLHIPGADDGLAIVRAMRHANPAAITFIFSGCPEMMQLVKGQRSKAKQGPNP